MLHPRRLATLVAAVAVAMVTLLTVDTAAFAADAVKVEIRGLGGTPVAVGGQGVSFQATFTNTTNEPLQNVGAAIAVRLDGVHPESVRVRRRQGADLPRSTSGDAVIFTDPELFVLQRDGGRSATRQYTLSFADDAPTGKASVTVVAHQNGATLGSDSGSITVVPAGDRGQATQTAPPNTDPGLQPTFEAGPTYSLAPLPVAEEPTRLQASVPKALYLLGGLLIVMGGASLFLIFRPPGRVPSRVTGAGPHRLSGPAWHPRGGPGRGAPQAWPTVSRMTPEPTRRMPLPGDGPATGTQHAVRDIGPHTGTTRPIRDPGPGEPLPPWLRR